MSFLFQAHFRFCMIRGYAIFYGRFLDFQQFLNRAFLVWFTGINFVLTSVAVFVHLWLRYLLKREDRVTWWYQYLLHAKRIIPERWRLKGLGVVDVLEAEHGAITGSDIDNFGYCFLNSRWSFEDNSDSRRSVRRQLLGSRTFFKKLFWLVSLSI